MNGLKLNKNNVFERKGLDDIRLVSNNIVFKQNLKYRKGVYDARVHYKNNFF